MTITNCRATFGLNAKVTPTKAGSNGTLQVGENNETVNLTSATKIVSFDAVIVGAASDLVIDVSDLDNTGSTAWTAGTAQVETATAAGTISGSGNASVVVTSAGMTGSPITLSVAVLASDTASAWATKVRTALNANAVIAERFTVGGSTTAISLTRKGTSTYTVNGTSVPVYPANDATLNISLDNGTCTGITTAATSANTTAGVATAGTYCPDLDGTSFEGEDIETLTAVHSILIKNDSTSPSYAIASLSGGFSGLNISEGNFVVMGGNGYQDFGDITINAASDCLVTVTIAGS